MNNLYKIARVLLLLAFLSIFIFNSCKDNINNPASEKTLSGTLVDEQGRGIPFAVLQVDNSAASVKSVIATDTTDEDGKFAISNLPEDLNVLKISITHPDFKNYTDNLSDFKTKCTTPVPLRHYDSCTAFFQMTIKGLPDSTMLDSVEVRMFRNNLIRKAYTSNGMVIFDNLCPGIYKIRIYKPGYKLTYLDFVFYGGDTIRLNYNLEATQADSCCHGEICVTPLDSATGQPLVGTTVNLYIGSTLVNTIKYVNAPVCFTGLCPGTYYIHLDMSGYNGAGIGATLKCNDTVPLQRALLKLTEKDTCCKGILKVFLKDKSTGKPPSPLCNVAIFQNGKELQVFQVNDNYAYFSNLCPGNYSIQVGSSWYEPLSWDYTSVCNKFDTTTLYLTPKANADSCCHGKITVFVKDSVTGANVDTIRVQISQNNTVIKYGYSSGGVVTFSGLCPGTYSIYEGSKTGWTRCNPFYWDVTLGCNDSASFTGLMKQVLPDTCCKGKIVVYVKHTVTGAPVDSASVILSKNGQNIQTLLTVNGMVTFTGICPGDYGFYYYKPNWYRPESLSWSVTMGCNDYSEFTKTMQPMSECCNGTISGVVNDSTSGSHIANAKVYLHNYNSVISNTTTDANGAFQFTGICPGQYSLSISAYYYYDKATDKFNAGCNDTSNNLTIQLLKK